MKDKSRKFLIYITSLLIISESAEAGGSSPYNHDLMGKCSSELSRALAPFRLSDGTTDENIQTTQTKFHSTSTWLIDKTSSHNYQWYLIEKGTRGYCYVLYVPFAAEVSGSKSGNAFTITAKSQPSPGAKGYEMMFRKSTKLGYFVPYKCSEITDHAKPNTKRHIIDCLAVGTE
jgi:hypothetical protein